MTRKDYEAIANALKHAYAVAEEKPNESPREILNRFTNRLCVIFEEDNSRFDPNKFWDAVDPDKD